MTGKISKKAARKQYRSPEAIARRNDQERVRQKELNDAFDNLRAHIPYGEWKGKKKSKCQTLEGAIEHIINLATMIQEADALAYGLQFSTMNNSYGLSPTSSADMFQSECSSPNASLSPNNSMSSANFNTFQEQNYFQTPQTNFYAQAQYPQTMPSLPIEEDTPLPPLHNSFYRYSPY